MKSNAAESTTAVKIGGMGKALILTMALTASLMLAAGCAAPQQEGYTGGVAATVNGVDIPEDDVTDEIQELRASMGLDDDESWGEFLTQYGYTPQSMREQIIDELVGEELVKQGAKDANITVEPDEVEGYVSQMRSNYDSDEAWQAALKSAGMSEDDYRESLENALLSSKFQDNLASESMTDEEKLAGAKDQASQYDGARRSSHILFAADDWDTAQTVLDQINSGQLDFAAAAEQYSTDTGSKTQGGDVGWDKLTTFVDEYQTALDGLEPNQVSGLVPSEFGIHIIKCTDKFTMPPELTSLDQIPAELLDAIETTLTSTNKQEAYSKWLEEQKSGGNVVINDMPSGLIYDIDLSAFQAADETEAAGAEGETADDASGDAASGDTADAGAEGAEG